MKLAISGGEGFLGFHLCNKLSEKFDEILVVDTSPIDPKEYPDNTRYCNVDVRDFKSLNKILADADIAIHAAAALPLCREKDIVSTNIEGTRNMLESAMQNGIKRVVFISSTAVYGIPEKHPIYESDLLVGVGPYGETKIEAEKICKEYRRKGMCVPVIRPKTFIGMGRLGVFHILYDWVRSGRRIPIIGSGKNLYQLLEVDDLVDAIYLMLTLPAEKVNDVFNIGAKIFGTVLEDVGALCDFAKTGARPMPLPSWMIKPLLEMLWIMRFSPLYKWVYSTADKNSFVSIEKSERLLGWMPRYSNAESLIKSYRYYLQHSLEIGRTGVTHRVPWKQGVLSLFKRFL